LRDTAGAYVLTLDRAGKIVRKDVSSTDSLGNDAIVTSGLASGDQVIVTSLQSLQAGGKATAVPWRASANAGSGSVPAPAQGGPPAPAKQ
jgi:membrane fusion protein (multidrug efflux system)